MRRIETHYADEGRETGLEFPDAYTLTFDPDVPVKARPNVDKVKEAMDELREEIIAALDQRRPPVFFLPPGMKLAAYETIKTIKDEDDDDD